MNERDTTKVLDVEYLSLWSNNNNKVYFSVAASTRTAAKNLVSSLYDNSGNSTELIIRAYGEQINNTNPYNPSDLKAFTYVYGKGG